MLILSKNMTFAICLLFVLSLSNIASSWHLFSSANTCALYNLYQSNLKSRRFITLVANTFTMVSRICICLSRILSFSCSVRDNTSPDRTDLQWKLYILCDKSHYEYNIYFIWKGIFLLEHSSILQRQSYMFSWGLLISARR